MTDARYQPDNGVMWTRLVYDIALVVGGMVAAVLGIELLLLLLGFD